VLTAWAFDSFAAQGLQRIELLHQQNNLASCRVAHKSGYALIGLLPADPPAFPAPGHLHARYRIPDGGQPILDAAVRARPAGGEPLGSPVSGVNEFGGGPSEPLRDAHRQA
jgi:hypothetical protein